MVPVPAPPPTPTGRGLTPREELLRDLRVAMLAEIVRAFDAILDAPPDEIRPPRRGRSPTG